MGLHRGSTAIINIFTFLVGSTSGIRSRVFRSKVGPRAAKVNDGLMSKTAGQLLTSGGSTWGGCFKSNNRDLSHVIGQAEQAPTITCSRITIPGHSFINVFLLDVCQKLVSFTRIAVDSSFS